MMRIMLAVMGVYLMGCYAYGVYLLVKVYTGRRMDRRSVALTREHAGLILRETSESDPAAMQHETNQEQAKAA